MSANRVFKGEEAHEVLPGLFIGSLAAAKDKQSLQDNGITHVLTTTGVEPAFPEDFKYHVSVHYFIVFLLRLFNRHAEVQCSSRLLTRTAATA